jgi:hypothetical protein
MDTSLELIIRRSPQALLILALHLAELVNCFRLTAKAVLTDIIS